MDKYCHNIIKLFLIFSLVLIFGCGEGTSVTNNSGSNSQQRAVQKSGVQPTPKDTKKNNEQSLLESADDLKSMQDELANETVYDYEGKIDPFDPLIKDKPKTETKKKLERKIKQRTFPPGPLEQEDISQLQLTGVIIMKSGSKALVVTSSGKGFVVKVGTYVGLNEGKITEILKDKIIIEEEIIDGVTEELKVEKRELKLQKPPGEW